MGYYTGEYKGPTKKNVSISMTQKGGKGSVNIQSGGDIHINEDLPGSEWLIERDRQKIGGLNWVHKVLHYLFNWLIE